MKNIDLLMEFESWLKVEMFEICCDQNWKKKTF